VSQSRKRNVTNVVASLLGYAVPLLVNFASTPYLMKSLGEDAFGIQVLVNVVIGYLALMDLGIGLPLIKYLAEDKAKGDIQSASELLSTTLVLYIGLGLVGMLVTMAFSDYLASSFFAIPDHFRDESKTVFQLAAAGFFASLIMGWGRSVAMGLQRYEVAYAISALSSVLGVGVGLYLIYTGFGVVGYVSSKVFFLFAAGLAYYTIYKVFLPKYNISFRFNRSAMLRIRSYLTYGIIHRGVTGFAGSIDKTLLGIWVGTASVGLYSLPYMLTSAVSYALHYTLSFVFPASSELHSTGQHERLRELFVNSTRFLVAESCMVFLPFFLLGDVFLNLWVGNEVAEKIIPVFYLLSLAVFIQVVLTSLIDCVMIGIGRIEQYTGYTVVRLMLFALLCTLFISKYDMMGAAEAMLLTGIVDIIYFVWVMKKHLMISIVSLLISAYLRPIFISMIVGLLLYQLHYMIESWAALLLALFCIELVTCILFYFCEVLTKEEKKILRNILVWKTKEGDVSL